MHSPCPLSLSWDNMIYLSREGYFEDKGCFGYKDIQTTSCPHCRFFTNIQECYSNPNREQKLRGANRRMLAAAFLIGMLFFNFNKHNMTIRHFRSIMFMFFAYNDERINKIESVHTIRRSKPPLYRSSSPYGLFIYLEIRYQALPNWKIVVIKFSIWLKT